jgi:anaerobic selenocysteine-containing dehydrogenase
MHDSRLTEIPTICGLCPQGCWVRAHVSKGELVAVTADSDPRHGGLCAKGRLAPQIVYSDDRIKTPMIRNGSKGKIAFREATWDEALNRIVQNFIKIRDVLGAKAVASYMGAGTLEDGLSDYFGKFLEPFGSPNDMNCGSVCYVSSRILAPVTTVGIYGESMIPDFENSKLIILWGTNPFKEGLPDKVKRIQKARSCGAKMIVLDPRLHRLMKNADHWIPIIPGTDGALILSLIHIIIDNKWYDREFVEKWTYGFVELQEYVSYFTAERASRICGIERKKIEWFAEAIAKTPGVAIDFYSGLEYSPSGVQNTRALYSLIALTGNLDIEGGLHIFEYPHKQAYEYPFDSEDIPLGSREYPLFYALTGKAHFSGLPAAVLHNDPYPVRGMLIIGGSPYRSYPDATTWKRVYERLDFMAVIDRFLPEEAAWADIVLPATTYYEIDSYHVYREQIRLRHKTIEPVADARNDSIILAEIAKRLGYGHLLPQSEEEIVKKTISNGKGLYVDSLERDGVYNLPIPERRNHKYVSGHLRYDNKPGFPTLSGKFEFKSTLLERYGYEPLPVYSDPRKDNYNLTSSFMLTSGARSRARFNSQFLDRPELAERNQAVVEINQRDAEMRGIQSGDMVSVRTSSGQIVLKALVTADICEGVVHVPFGGGGHRQIGSWKQANVNALIPSDVKDRISGYPVLKSVVCDLTREDEQTNYKNSISLCNNTEKQHA